MRKLLIVAAIVASFASFTVAQNTDKRGEFFAGYSVLRTDINTEDFSSPIASSDEPFKNLHGVNVAATGYFSPRVGITGDFSAHFKTESDNAFGDAKARSFNFLAGPQVRFTNSTRVTPFVRALAGVQHNRLEFDAINTTPVTTNFETSATDFALALGGGVDVGVSDNFAVRLFQIDYNPTFARDRSINFGGTTTAVDGERVDNVRFSVGVVFK